MSSLDLPQLLRLHLDEEVKKSSHPKLESIQSRLAQLLDDRHDLQSLANEPGELGDMARSDLESNKQSVDELLHESSKFLLPENKFDSRNASLEVLPGAGGMEASIFAQEIFTLYTNYAYHHGFDVQVDEIDTTNHSGVYKATASIKGHGAFSLFKYECGVHRVQRVPVTATGKKSGVLQTSTCSLAVLPEPDEADVTLSPKTLKVEFVRSSGPGGQGVNTTNSACRVVHLPTGVSIKNQETRSAELNHKRALEKLKSMLFQSEFEKQVSQAMRFRKSQIGNMNRNEKIRTYNFSRHQISDHRINESKQVTNLSDFLAGQLGFQVIDSMREKLQETHEIQSLTDFLSNT